MKMIAFNFFAFKKESFKKFEAATGGVLKNFTKFTGKHLC